NPGDGTFVVLGRNSERMVNAVIRVGGRAQLNAMTSPLLAHVDLQAIRDNVALLTDRAGAAAVMAMVKADGYGHGAVPAARAALAGGATWLGVARQSEALQLRA